MLFSANAFGEAPSGRIAPQEDMTDVIDIVDESMTPVTADMLNDSVYDVAVDVSSAMFKVVGCELTVAGGAMTAKLHMKSDASTMWFDGKTLWTYMASNEEVNISRPTKQQLQTLNPYTFINLYKKGYKETMTSSATEHIVHLTATDPQHRIREAFITVDKTSYAPKTIKMLIDQKWTTFTVTGLKQEKLADSRFSFDADAYPDAEIIDLR